MESPDRHDLDETLLRSVRGVEIVNVDRASRRNRVIYPKRASPRVIIRAHWRLQVTSIGLRWCQIRVTAKLAKPIP
jgi:hypothetical protein